MKLQIKTSFISAVVNVLTLLVAVHLSYTQQNGKWLFDNF